MMKLILPQHLLLLFSLLTCSISASSETKLIKLKDVGVSYGSGYPLIVFASPTCPFCRKFHTEVLPELVENGFEVIYLIIAHDKYKSYKRASQIYCAENKKAQLNDFHTALLPKELVDGKPCESMVEEMLNVASMYQLTSTPTIVLPDESILKGVSSVEKILPRYISALSKND